MTGTKAGKNSLDGMVVDAVSGSLHSAPKVLVADQRFAALWSR